MKKILFVIGTRPEAIKTIPLIKELRGYPDLFNVKVCITAQHREMLDQVMSFFGISADYDLNIMTANQTLFSVTSAALLKLEPVLNEFQPDNIIVQGDTTTVMAGSIAAFYEGVSISHLEAGLRSYNKRSPFPEEVNRRITSHIADYHFAPTQKAVENLASEGITENVWMVGNTVIDALFMALGIIEKQGNDSYFDFFKNLDFVKRIILVTGHRRESFGKPFENMCEALKTIALEHPDTEIVYPVHLNPNVRKTVGDILKNISNVYLFEPFEYPRLIWIMNRSFMILTDSGGIQEEAPALGKPVLVMRDVTERTEGIEAGTAKLVGTDKEVIIRETQLLLNNPQEYQKMSNAVNPYGDGTSSKQIADAYKVIFNC